MEPVPGQPGRRPPSHHLGLEGRVSLAVHFVPGDGARWGAAGAPLRITTNGPRLCPCERPSLGRWPASEVRGVRGLLVVDGPLLGCTRLLQTRVRLCACVRTHWSSCRRRDRLCGRVGRCSASRSPGCVLTRENDCLCSVEVGRERRPAAAAMGRRWHRWRWSAPAPAPEAALMRRRRPRPAPPNPSTRTRCPRWSLWRRQGHV